MPNKNIKAIVSKPTGIITWGSKKPSITISKASSWANIATLINSYSKGIGINPANIKINITGLVNSKSPFISPENCIIGDSFIEKANKIKDIMNDMITAEDWKGITEAYQIEIDFASTLAEIEASIWQIEQTIDEIFNSSKTDIFGVDDAAVAAGVWAFAIGVVASLVAAAIRDYATSAPTDTDGDGTPDNEDSDDDNDGVEDQYDKHPKSQGNKESEDNRNGCVPPIVWNDLINQIKNEFLNGTSIDNNIFQPNEWAINLYEYNNAVKYASILLKNKSIFTIKVKF